MSGAGRAVAHAFRILMLSLLPIVFGILKIYLHYQSVFRSGLLDYFVAAGAIFGGIFLFFRNPPKTILLISGSLIIVEIYKAIVDYSDLFDVALAIIAIIYLSIPFLRYLLRTGRPK